MITEKKTKVIFRRFYNGEIIALFPELPGTKDQYTCLSYMHNGQHSAASISVASIAPFATEKEYQDLYNELVSLGYKLQVSKKFTEKAKFIRLEKIWGY